MQKKIDYTLYCCTDKELMLDEIEDCVEQAIMGGATVIQLREKDCPTREIFETAKKVKEVTDRHGVALIINDRVDIALAIDADGVHLGDKDLDCATARKILGEDKIIGVTARTLDDAVKAEQSGADYLCVGSMAAINPKKDKTVVAPDDVILIRSSVNIPVVIMGGINKENISKFKHLGADGIAVVTAIVAQADVEEAARELKQLWTN